MRRELLVLAIGAAALFGAVGLGAAAAGLDWPRGVADVLAAAIGAGIGLLIWLNVRSRPRRTPGGYDSPEA